MKQPIQFKKFAQKEDFLQEKYNDFLSNIPEKKEDYSFDNALALFQKIVKISEDNNLDIMDVYYNLPQTSEKIQIKSYVENYIKNKEKEKQNLEQQQRLEQEETERQNRSNKDKENAEYNSLEAQLQRATDYANYFSNEWDKIIQTAEEKNIDPEVYVRAFYPDDHAEMLLLWIKIKNGEINKDNLDEELSKLSNEERIAVEVNNVNSQEIDNFNQSYDDQQFQEIINYLRSQIQNAQEFIENIDWSKVGAFLNEGANRVIYQILKPGSIIKKSRSAIQAIIGLMNDVDNWSEEYHQHQDNREKAERELDDFVERKSLSRNNKINKRQIIASLIKIANDLDDMGLHDEADSTTQVIKKIDRTDPIYNVDTDDYDLSEIQKDTLDQILRLFDNILQITFNHKLLISKLGYSVNNKNQMLDAFIKQVISKIENIDFSGTISQSESMKEGFLGKITSRFKSIDSDTSEDFDHLSKFQLSRIDKVINKIESVCKKALLKINKIHNKLPFEDRIKELQNNYIDILKSTLSENIPQMLDQIYNLDGLKRK